jgi:hypothetical protein
VAAEASRRSRHIVVVVPFDRGDLLRVAHDHTEVIGEKVLESGWRLELRVPVPFVGRFTAFEEAAAVPEEARDPDGAQATE